MYCEVAHEFCFPCDAYAVFYVVAAVINVLQSCCDDIHVVVCINAAGDAETEKIQATEAVLACDRVTVGEDVAYFAATDASFEIKFDSECLCREFFLRHVGEDAVSIDEESVATDRALVRDAIFV